MQAVRRLEVIPKEMKRSLFVLCCTLLVMTGCKDKATATASQSLQEEELTELSGSDEAEADEEVLEELLVDETPMPVAAEELFDDFFFNYASSMRVQLERTVFPLVSRNGEITDTIDRAEWKFNPFFMQQGYYTLIFDKESQIELVKDTSVGETVVETFLAYTDSVVHHHFKRSNGKWQLFEVRRLPLDGNPNASFVCFYRQFVSDSVFQQQSLAHIIEFSGPDPDDEDAEMKGFITPDSWEGFAPQFPELPLYNIVYGRQDTVEHQRIFIIRGISNGEELEVTFNCEGNSWKLVKLFE